MGLAEEFHGRVVEYDEMTHALPDVDIVITIQRRAALHPDQRGDARGHQPAAASPDGF